MAGVVVLTGVVILAVADRNNRVSTDALVTSLFRETSNRAATQTRDYVLRAAPVARSLQQLSDRGLALDDLDRLAPQLLAFLQGNDGLTWVLYGDESGDYVGTTRLKDGQIHIERTHLVDGRTHFTEYAVQTDGTWKVVAQEEDRHYDPRQRPYYALARQSGQLAWTRPYMFFSQGVPGISCVLPVYRPSGKLRGVFSVEFDFNELSGFIGRLSISDHSRLFLFTPDQTLLAHPSMKNLRGNRAGAGGRMLTLADTGDPLVDAFRKHIRPGDLRSTGADGFHFLRFQHDGVNYLASTTVFPISDDQSWVIGAIAPRADFEAGAWRTRWQSLAVAAGALCLAALLAAALARHISEPIRALVSFMGRVGDGDLHANADFHGGREFHQLSTALNHMIADLRERLQLRSSLQVAMEVQNSLLPACDPALRGLYIAGRTKYCDETGGDYFDFVEVEPTSESSLLVAVGDVMGHGVAAALLMATARAVLRCRALDRPGLGALMTRINQVLAANNRHHRFMTLALLEIDGRNATVGWASAGHDPAIVLDPATGQFEELDAGDIPLGLDERVEYADYRSRPFAPGTVMVMGTDGIWETLNTNEELYGKDRLRQVIRANCTLPAKQIATALETDLAGFRGPCSPHDDVTFVIVKFLDATPPQTPAPPLGT
jgi:sigma-B regulation protein RsbU (phosphoserine phosphatase)